MQDLSSPEVCSVATCSPNPLQTTSPANTEENADSGTLFNQEKNEAPFLSRRINSKIHKDQDHDTYSWQNTNSSEMVCEQQLLKDVRRLSGQEDDIRTPQTSQVIEALVLDRTPPHPHRKLRHAVKDLYLRDTSSHGGHSNRTSYSDASILVPTVSREDRLSTQLGAVPSLESDRSESAGLRTLRPRSQTRVCAS